MNAFIPSEPAARVVLAGVAASSPLFCLLSSLAPAGTVIAGGGAVEPAGAWRKQIFGTTLQWWDEAATGDPARLPADAIRLDLFGGAFAPPTPRRWLLADGAGRPALCPFAFLDTVHRNPFVATLRLLEGDPRHGSTDVLLAEASVSSRQPYRALLATIGSAAARLVAGAITDRHPDDRAQSPRRRAEPLRSGPPGWRSALLRAWLRTEHMRWHSRFYQESWGIGVSGLTIPALIAAIETADMPEPVAISATALEPLDWLGTPELDGYLADPFAHPTRRNEILFEVYDNATGRGTLATAAIGPGVDTRQVSLSFDLDCHLSYPFAWQEDGRVFCLPESGAARTTRIYELTGDDNRATEIARVCDGPAAADPTLFRFGSYYWIAYTDTDIGVHDNLCLLYSEGLEGPWQPHRGNPVKWDVRSSRPGGTPFEYAGKLYRPAQNCAATYGAALAINRVLICNPDRYEEETVAMILPDRAGPYPVGLHTLSVDPIGGRLLIDGKRYSLNLGAIARKLRDRLRRIVTRG